jgi:hypothetical protein
MYAGLLLLGAVMGACMIAIVIWKREDRKRLINQKTIRSLEVSRTPSTTNIVTDCKIVKEKEPMLFDMSGSTMSTS